VSSQSQRTTGFEMTDKDFIAQFERGTPPAEGFHHEQHVRMAYAYLRRYPLLQALERFSAALRRFAISQGKTNLYNETITWAYLFLIHERMSKAEDTATWERFASANPDLLQWKGGILQRFYSPQTLGSDLAKRTFIFPDKLA
jgi:hypothetical protein